MKKIISVLCVLGCFSCMGMDRHTTFASATTDTGFKQLISNLDVAKSIITSIIPEIQINTIEVCPLALPVLKERVQKQTFMDFHVKTNSGEHIVIEMQARRHVMFDKRALFYASHTYVNQLTDEELKQENWYKFIKAVYAIQFLDFDTNIAKGIKRDIHDTLIDRVKAHPMGNKDYIKHYLMTDKYSRQTIGALQMIQIELPRANTLLNLKPSNTQKFGSDLKLWWLSLIKNSSQYDEATVSIAPDTVKTGFEQLKYSTWNPKIQQIYDDEISDLTKYETDVNDKVQQGIQQVRTELQPQIDKLLTKQIRQNYRKFKDVLGKSSDGKLSFRPSKLLKNVNVEKIQAALTNSQKDREYEGFINCAQQIGTLPETDMTDNSYSDV